MSSKILFLTFFIISCHTAEIATGQYCDFTGDTCAADGCCVQVSPAVGGV